MKVPWPRIAYAIQERARYDDEDDPDLTPLLQQIAARGYLAMDPDLLFEDPWQREVIPGINLDSDMMREREIKINARVIAAVKVLLRKQDVQDRIELLIGDSRKAWRAYVRHERAIQERVEQRARRDAAMVEARMRAARSRFVRLPRT